MRFKIQDSRFKIQTTSRPGIALLVVLFIVMAVTVLSLAFLSGSDVELACGQNMTLRTGMDYLAESGLEHAKGLLLNPQDIDGPYWAGAERQQLYAGRDYYDVDVNQLGPSNYQITSTAYRERAGRQVGRSSLQAELRLDPAVALWTGADTTINSGTTISGDVYCSGTLTNTGTINGDVFSASLKDDVPLGHIKPAADLSLGWPGVTVDDFTSHYSVQSVSGSISGRTFGPYEPVRVCYSDGDLALAGNVTIDGMLLVEGDLTVTGTGNILRAGKNLPALFVTGDMSVANGASLDIHGLAVVDGRVQISGGAGDINILGGLFTKADLAQVAWDSSGNGHAAALLNGAGWRPGGGYSGGAVEFDGIDDRMEDAEMDDYLNGRSAVTVSLWVKSDVTDQDRGIFFTRNPTDRDEELGMRYDKNGAFGGGRNVIKASIRTTSGYTQIESTSNVQATNWQHLALVWQSGSSLKLYINGQLNEPLTHDRGPVSGAITGVDKLMFGQDTKGKYWDGLIDDVRIYDRALSDPNDIYPPVDGLPGLIAHWRLNDAGADIELTAAPAETAIFVWSAGEPQKWAQAAGAFWRSIERK